MKINNKASKLVAHRGDNTNYPENSYAAIEAALKAGALNIEFDIQVNADGALLVFHDTDFKRVGDLDVSIFDLSNDQIRALSAHLPDRFGDKFLPTQVSYLDEILDLLQRYPKIHAFVEIKRESLARWGLAEVLDKIFKALRGFESQVTIISFSSSAIKYTQQHSKLRTGFVFYQYNECTQNISTILQPDYLICAYTIFPEKDKLWQGNWQWMVYSINDIELMKQLCLRDEISLIETDNISLMLQSL